VQYDIYCEGQDLQISNHAITVLLYTFCGNKYFMPKVFFYINIVYYIIFKWNIELLQIFIFELVQYTYSVQIQGYIARLARRTKINIEIHLYCTKILYIKHHDQN
jgi:hypothetical protein